MKYINTNRTFDFNIAGLSGTATLFKFDDIYKFVDLEHNITGGGYYDFFEARKMFLKKIKELAA